MNSYYWLTGLWLCCCSFGCTTNNGEQKHLKSRVDDSVHLTRQDTFLIHKEKVFKQWLNDTIPKIDTGSLSMAGKSNNIMKVLKLRPDSLGFSIITYYHCKIDSKREVRIEKDLDNFLSLLKEYNEFPKYDFLITFHSDYFYHPSPVPQLLYERVYKIYRIEVRSLDGNNVSKYGYIRGSLSHKEVVTVNENGNVEAKLINFIWDDGKLIKSESQ